MSGPLKDQELNILHLGPADESELVTEGKEKSDLAQGCQSHLNWQEAGSNGDLGHDPPSRHSSTDDDGEPQTCQHHYPRLPLYIHPIRDEVQNGWYNGEACVDPIIFYRVVTPNIDESIVGSSDNHCHSSKWAFPTMIGGSRPAKSFTRLPAQKDAMGMRCPMSQKEHLHHMRVQVTQLKGDNYWRGGGRYSHIAVFPVLMPVWCTLCRKWVGRPGLYPTIW